MRPDVLLIDGDCGLCRRSGDWLARHVDDDVLRVVEFQAIGGDEAREALAAATAGLDLAEAVTLVGANGTVRRGAAAVLGAGRHVPGLGVAAAIYDNKLGHALWEPAYRAVAANRHRIGRALGIEAVCARITE
jgi:predicted DCC family thiol-disulfide oxidoreductase YuxK